MEAGTFCDCQLELEGSGWFVGVKCNATDCNTHRSYNS